MELQLPTLKDHFAILLSDSDDAINCTYNGETIGECEKYQLVMSITLFLENKELVEKMVEAVNHIKSNLEHPVPSKESYENITQLQAVDNTVVVTHYGYILPRSLTIPCLRYLNEECVKPTIQYYELSKHEKEVIDDFIKNAEDDKPE